MKQYIFITISLVSMLSIKAQNSFSVEKGLFKINVLLPSVAYEYGVNKKNTLYTELRMDFGYKKDYFGNKGWFFFPAIEEEFRHYYNIESRGLKGKVTKGNSGAYMALMVKYWFRSLTTNKNMGYYDPSLLVGPVWGFQRTYKGGFSVNLEAGLGRAFIFSENYTTNQNSGIINISLGWVIGGK